MFIQEDYNTIPGGTARLMSPLAKVQPVASCLEFWYHMYGRDIESLKVYIMKSGSTDLPANPVWSMSGDKGNYWHRATVTVPVTDYTFKVGMHAAQRWVKPIPNCNTLYLLTVTHISHLMVSWLWAIPGEIGWAVLDNTVTKELIKEYKCH